MAKSYSKTPRTDAVKMIIDTLFLDKEYDDTAIMLREKLLYLLQKLVNGRRFKKTHFEQLYSKLLENRGLSTFESKSELKIDDEVVQKTLDQPTPQKSDLECDVGEISGQDSDFQYQRILTAIQVINTMLTCDDIVPGPPNFIYFNGYKSGISMTKNAFSKCFIMSVWFRLEDIDYSQTNY